jgi:hypothetical protein
MTCYVCNQQLEEALPEAYSILAANPLCEGMGDQLNRFRERAREIVINDDASLRFS